MSNQTDRPQWHEPVDGIGSDVDDPLEDTVEVGQIQLADGPIDPVPFSTGPRNMENYNPSRSSAGSMPPINGQSSGDNASDTKSVVGAALNTVKSAAGNAGAVTKSAVSSAAGTVSSATTSSVRTAGMATWDIVQRNPLQALLVIASLIWLLRNNKATASQPPVSLPDVGEKVGAIAGQVQSAAGNVADQVQTKAGTVAGQVQTAASNLGNQVGEQAQRAQGWFGQTLQRSPLALGAMAAVLGAALGFAVPETAQENQWMGSMRDKIADKAQGAVEDLSQKVQTVAQSAVHEAIETVKEEAKNQGLTQ